MPRAGWVKPESDRRLSDLVSVGVLTRVFPPGLVDEVIAEAGRTEQRHRSLPARVMAYFSIGMALYSEGSYEDVLAQLTRRVVVGLGLAGGVPAAEQVGDLPGSGAVGFGAVGGVVRAGGRPDRRTDATPGVWLAGRRLVAIDGTCLDVADTAVNAAFFGRPGVNKGEQAAFPQARVVALAECGTHAIFAAAGRGVHRVGEPTLTEALLDRSGAGDAAAGRSRVLLLRLVAQGDRRPAPTCCGGSAPTRPAPSPSTCETFADGSWLAHLRRATAGRGPPSGADAGPGDRLPHRRRPREHPTSYRLFTTILDPAEAPAAELAAAYAQRWEIELAFDELKTHQRGPRTRAALEVPRPGPARDLGTPVLPLRDPLPDGRGRHPRRTRPRPGQLRRRAADHPGRPSPTPGAFPP